MKISVPSNKIESSTSEKMLLDAASVSCNSINVQGNLTVKNFSGQSTHDIKLTSFEDQQVCNIEQISLSNFTAISNFEGSNTSLTFSTNLESNYFYIITFTLSNGYSSIYYFSGNFGSSYIFCAAPVFENSKNDYGYLSCTLYNGKLSARFNYTNPPNFTKGKLYKIPILFSNISGVSSILSYNLSSTKKLIIEQMTGGRLSISSLSCGYNLNIPTYEGPGSIQSSTNLIIPTSALEDDTWYVFEAGSWTSLVYYNKTGNQNTIIYGATGQVSAMQLIGRKTIDSSTMYEISNCDYLTVRRINMNNYSTSDITNLTVYKLPIQIKNISL